MSSSAYVPLGWENSPSQKTPINAINLNKMDSAIKYNRDAIINLENNYLPVSRLANNLVTTAANYGLDARQGKVLDDKIATINSSLGVMKNILFTVINNSSVTKELSGVYLVSYWQGAAWMEKGFGILYVSTSPASSIYKPLYDSVSASVEITSNGDGTATFKNNIMPYLFFSLTKLM